ncbi:MAG: hypothetical protein EXR28_17235 [Betaproteobacteria bacterium]|nr:hypothetical protein [Betaproteobacteria bacterium]
MSWLRFRIARTERIWLRVFFFFSIILTVPVGNAQIPADAPAPVEAWFYLGRQNESGAWAPASASFRMDSPRAPKRVTVLRDAVLVDNINPDTAGAAAQAANAGWTRVARRGAAVIALLEVVRQDSVGNGKLVWGKVRVPEERVELRASR